MPRFLRFHALRFFRPCVLREAHHAYTVVFLRSLNRLLRCCVLLSFSAELQVKMWGRPASHVRSSGGNGEDTGNERMDSVAGAERAPAAPATDGAAMGIVKDELSSSSLATTSARWEHRGLVPHRAGAGVSGPTTEAARKTKERPQQGVAEVRFEVCSPRLGGAVVVADGRAVVKRGERLGEGVLKEEMGAPRNRSRL